MALLSLPYDTSFLKRKEVIISGDVESNPGPFSSVVAYRSAVGRFSASGSRCMTRGKTSRETEWVHLALFVCILAMLQVALYGLVVVIAYTCFIYCVAFLAVIATYGCSCFLLRYGCEIVSRKFRNVAKGSALMRTPKGSLVPCSYLDTFVLDGRCRYGGDPETRVANDVVNETIFSSVVNAALCSLMANAASCSWLVNVSAYFGLIANAVLYCSLTANAAVCCGTVVTSLLCSSTVKSALCGFLAKLAFFGSTVKAASYVASLTTISLRFCFACDDGLFDLSALTRTSNVSNVSHHGTNALDSSHAVRLDQLNVVRSVLAVLCCVTFTRRLLSTRKNGEIRKRIVNAISHVVFFASVALFLRVSYHALAIDNGNCRFKSFAAHENNTANNGLELYLLSHLKLAQLLVDGDVESNPGPVGNDVGTPKGRGRGRGSKKRVFGNSKPRKLDFSSAVCSNANVVDFAVGENRRPVRLENQNNVCFFNSVVQVFHSIPSFRTHVVDSAADNNVVNKLRNLFRQMNTSAPGSVLYTAGIVRDLGIPNYVDDQQHDALELLRHVLDHTDVMDSIFRIDQTKSILCGTCGRESFTSCNMPVFTLDVDSHSQQTISGLLDRTLDSSGYLRPEYRCEIARDDVGNEVLDENGNRQGCGLRGTCSESIQITEVGENLILQLKVYTEDEYGEKSKIIPDMTIDQQIRRYAFFELQGIVWHHGRSWQNGHYTADVKVDGVWYSTSDTSVNEGATFECSSDGDIAPYIVVYRKRDEQRVVLSTPGSTNEGNVVSPAVEVASTPSTRSDEGTDDTATKRKHDGSENDDKRKRGFNLAKRKSKFSYTDDAARQRKRRATAEGKASSDLADEKYRKKMRDTAEGRTDQQEWDRKSKEKIRSTSEGGMKHRESEKEAMKKKRSTPEGKEAHRSSMEKARDVKKAERKEKISSLPFPPVVDDEVESRCVKEFIRATSSEFMQTEECGICGESVMKRDRTEENRFRIDEIPGRDSLRTEHQENRDFLEEYVFDDLLLSPGGVDDVAKSVLCCNTCLSSLRKNKLPKFSIANDFQIGKTPPSLTDLTLCEKLLISKCRPKMYVVKLRSTSGPQGQQRGLKGNTITFPQDVVKIAATLPASPDVLVDHLKVVFIGRGRPSREMLKKVFTVRREKVYAALEFLVENNPVYADVTLSDSVDLPVDDVPTEILRVLDTHDDSDDEDAKEHSTYTPQTDLDDVPPDTVVMDSVGMVNLDGSNVNANDQMNSAISSLQGTIVVPHGSVPVNEYSNPTLWLGAYPWLFPYGRGGPESQRKVQVGLRAYVRHLLKLADRKFSLDPSLKFHAFNVIQKRDVSYHTSLHVRRREFDAAATRIDALTAESMDELTNCVQNKTPITDPNLRTLLDSLNSTGKHINGSPYQKSTYRREIFGLMIREGTPVLWITLSPAVIHSPVFLRIAGYSVDLNAIPSHVERAKLVASDPVAAAMYFNEIVDGFTEFLLGYGSCDGGIFGHPSAFYGMTEEQGTGTLHNHMLVWLHNFKSASKLKSDLEDETFRNSLIDYLERIIKQGYLGTDSVETDVDVSRVSCKAPVEREDPAFEDDVNDLVTVCNTHKCRETCHKYQLTDEECRFDYPRELVPETKIEGSVIKLKRTSEMINNFNPSVMTCVRSNHDIKFIPSGKDGRNIAFYVTNYATKSQLSTHQMVPLIAASKKRADADASNACSDVRTRTKRMITKCLNRITTESEISASHVSHFLLGNSDSKTSHKFTSLNLHSALAWLAEEIRKCENSVDHVDNGVEGDLGDGSVDETASNADADSDVEDDDDDEEEESTTYTIGIGNEGYVFVNRMVDYINRGEALQHMCLYDYTSSVYKAKFSEEELKKRDEKTKQCSRPCEQRHEFLPEHPQSETHWQKVRIEGSDLVPSLSKLPPSSKSNRDKYQKCILLLFKPFASFEELFSGATWNETFSDFLEVTEHTRYIENLDELHIGIEEKRSDDAEEANDDELADEIVDDECDDESNRSGEADEGLDERTTTALDVIRGTSWLEESIRDGPSQSTEVPAFVADRSLPPLEVWEREIERQKKDALNAAEPQPECEVAEEPVVTTADFADTRENDVEFSVERSSDDGTRVDSDSVERIVENTIAKYSLNREQKIAFESAIENVVKRHRGEQTEQFLAFVGGPGGTGKSQVIKAIVHFHKKMKLKRALKLCANTGTAAKNIGGSTTTTLFGFASRQKDAASLQRKFEKVDTIVLDEVSLVGSRQLAKIGTALSTAKCADASLPFGGVDMIFCGDFIQFPPVKDSPLYNAWGGGKVEAKTSQYGISKELGLHLWKQVNRIFILHEQMRVQDAAYLAMLNRLREGKCTEQDVQMLYTRVVGQSCDVTAMSGAPIVTPGNELVMAVNDLFVARHAQQTDVYVSTAKDHICDGRKRKPVPKKLSRIYKNWANTATHGLPRELKLYVGMPVIVTINVATELGITNGTTGVVRSIHLKDGEVISEETGFHQLDEQPEYVIVEMDSVSMTPLPGLPPNHVPVAPIRSSFSVRVPGRNKRININRKHFPLVPLFSCTAHKSQGQTLSKAIVDLVPVRKGGVGVEFAYVPLSRVRRLDDLIILRPFDPTILRAKVNERCALMMEEFAARDECRQR